MSTSLKIWKHPTSGQVRVYVSGLTYQGGAKVWFEAYEADSFGCDWTVKTKVDYNMDTRKAKDQANEMFWHDGQIAKFADIVAAAQ